MWCHVCTSKFQLSNMDMDSSDWNSFVRKLSAGKEYAHTHGNTPIPQGQYGGSMVGLWRTAYTIVTHKWAQCQRSPEHESYTAVGQSPWLNSQMHSTQVMKILIFTQIMSIYLVQCKVLAVTECK